MREVESAVVPAVTSLAFCIYLRDTPRRVCEALADPALVPSWLAGMSSGPAGEEDPRRLTCEWLLADYFEINGGGGSGGGVGLFSVGPGGPPAGQHPRGGSRRGLPAGRTPPAPARP